MRVFRSTLVFVGMVVALVAARPQAQGQGQGQGQEVRVDGPPPALRRNLDAFMKAFNSGDAAQYETMAKTVFTEGYLKRETADERKKAFTKMRADLGTIQITQVERRGPEAPLQAFVKGSVAPGVLWIELDDASKVDSLKHEVSKKQHADRPH